ncbi:MAG: SDR family NAD(P)-dependent oxidoreductase [Parvibaculales bacterium]
MGKLKNKVAIITGGTSGIGAGTVARFVEEGAKVIFTGSNEEKAQKVCTATGAEFIKHKVQDEAAWQELMAHVQENYGRLDIMFANAGTEMGDASVEDIPLENWQNLIDINLTGMMLSAQMAVRAMRQNPDGPCGSIIMNSSMNAFIPMGNYVTYSTTKGALIALAKSVAMHCANQGLPIRCNSIHPGVVETEMITNLIDGSPDPAATRAGYESMAPLKRMATVEEVAGLVTYLASDEASFISGAEYKMDGATTSGMMGL